MAEPVIFKQYDDGYIVREMTKEDAQIVQSWYCGMGKISKYDLNICLEVFPSKRGFCIGEFKGEVVASAIRIPWSDRVFYGSYYYVEKAHRGRGFGTRLRDEVAREYVGDNQLCVDAVTGKVSQNNEDKFGYTYAFQTARFEVKAKQDYCVKCDCTISKCSDINLDNLIEYDNKCFIGKNNPTRKAFLAKWIQIPDGAAYVALSNNNEIVGYGCRRPCLQDDNDIIGPLYANSQQVAEYLLQKLCADVSGRTVTINIWCPNSAAVEIIKKFDFKHVFDCNRMHVNGNPNEYKETTYGLTSIDVCGF